MAVTHLVNTSARSGTDKSPKGVNGRTPVKKRNHDSVQHGGYDSEKTENQVHISKSHFDSLLLAVIMGLAFVTRFYHLDNPDQVVFDEVHFGKFAAYYLRREFFFDVHPPLGKLLFAFIGWLSGYDGKFLFEKIGDSYIQNQVPYIVFRSLPALFGALTVPLVFLSMREMGFSLLAAVLSSSMLIFDNGHIAEDRLILLDASLSFFVTWSIYSYIKFWNTRDRPFTGKWFLWLFLTGVGLSGSLGIKMVGLFTFATIGLAVIYDLWGIIDYRRGHSLTYIGAHFASRFFFLIVTPFLFYLSFFWVHFAILNRSGSGDDFMSSEFQKTLIDSPMNSQSIDINYYDTVLIKNRMTKGYLHSHFERYPLRYDDGRISSQGQQVTGYPTEDSNNEWIILPAQYYDRENIKRGQKVRIGDSVRFYHINTDSFLLTHDVASPYYPTNQEFTTVTQDIADGERYHETIFQLGTEFKPAGEALLQTKSVFFNVKHNDTQVYMWSHTKVLPDWGFFQYEINGHKNQKDHGNYWVIDDILNIDDETRRDVAVPELAQMSFIRKFLELQDVMIAQNNLLTDSHPYASRPLDWFLLSSGVSFWISDNERKQIYFLLNPVAVLIGSVSVFCYLGILLGDQVSRRRGTFVLSDKARVKLYENIGFCMLAWVTHYVPFFLMGRQLFLHHYLPAFIMSTMLAGATIQFFFDREFKERNISLYRLFSEPRQRNYFCLTVVLVTLIILTFYLFAPLTYGHESLTPEQLAARKWQPRWNFHYMN